MYIQGQCNLLFSITCLGLFVLVQGAPQQAEHRAPQQGENRPKLKGYKMSDLPRLSETEVEENEAELLEVIRAYGPRALIALNHTKYYRRGFEENFSDCRNSSERQAEYHRRWSDLMNFFDTPGGMDYFKTFFWPHYEKPPTRGHTTKTTPHPDVFWNPEVAKKYFGVNYNDVSWDDVLV